MEASIFEVMREQVRTIYQAATGRDIADQGLPEASAEISLEELTQRFADLESMARRSPGITERVPPFSFQPLIDVIEHPDEWVIELAVPGIAPDEISVERVDHELRVSGVRKAVTEDMGKPYLHAEIPRGPFRRSVTLPFQPESEPRVEGNRGLIRIHIEKPSSPEDTSSSERGE